MHVCMCVCDSVCALTISFYLIAELIATSDRHGC